MKKLLVLGGTRISCEIVKKAQEMGYFVGVTDYNETENSPGKQIADAVHDISCTDIEAVSKLVIEEKYDGVLTGFNDLLLPYYAEICEATDRFCYGNREQFELFTQKKKYKKLLRQFGIPVVEDYSDPIKDGEAENLQFPVIVKPSDDSGSRGVKICSDIKELNDAYEKALECSHRGDVIVERFMPGREATAFWLFVNGEHYFCGIGNRHINGIQDGCIPLPVGYTFPSVFTEKYIEDVVPKARQMFRSVGIKNGMMFMQCKTLNGICYVHDIGYRLTGSLEYKLFDACCDFNPLEIMIRQAVGDHGEESIQADPYFRGRFPYNVSILAGSGMIKEINGLDTVKNMDGVVDIVMAHDPGEQISEKMRGLLAQITVRVLGVASDRNKLIPTMKAIEDTIKIVSTDDHEMTFGRMEDCDLDMVVE